MASRKRLASNFLRKYGDVEVRLSGGTLEEDGVDGDGSVRLRDIPQIKSKLADGYLGFEEPDELRGKNLRGLVRQGAKFIMRVEYGFFPDATADLRVYRVDSQYYEDRHRKYLEGLKGLIRKEGI